MLFQTIPPNTNSAKCVQKSGRAMLSILLPRMESCEITTKDKLQKLQNRDARIVTNSPYNTSALPIIKQLGWKTVNDLIEIECLKMLYKSTHNEAPSYLACLFDKWSETSSWKLRNINTDLSVRLLQTTCGQNTSLLEEQNFGMALIQNIN